MRKFASEMEEVQVPPEESAKAVGLKYVHDNSAGIIRKKAGKTFTYQLNGKKLSEEPTLRRIRSLAIPPAWTEVWICPYENGHLQATGRDAKGRKQYRYHKRWREVRDDTKFNRMIAFARALPKIRNTIQQHLGLSGLPREKVLATVVRLLEVSLIRVGNDEYARTNKSFGLTTLKDKHVDINGSEVVFQFRGKSGKSHSVAVQDARLARIVQKCQEIPGQELFQYIDQLGQRHDVTSGDVNAYLREISGEEFTAKDFRTWAGTVLAAMALQEFQEVDTKTQAKKNLLRAIENVSQRLGNTPSICRKCYIHPAIMNSYMDGTLLQTLKDRAEKQIRSGLGRLKPEEAAVVAFLRAKLAEQTEPLESKLARSISKMKVLRRGRG
jgi:DNA topoisomerase-1